MAAIDMSRSRLGHSPPNSPVKAPKDAVSRSDAEKDVSSNQKYWSPVRDGNVAMVRSLCDCIKAEGSKLPLNSMLRVAVQGSSVEMLDYLFSEGARVELDIDYIRPAPGGRPIDFFRSLTKHGWPKGPRGLALNLHHGLDVVHLILERGSRIGFLCVKSAVRSGDVGIAELLMERIDPAAKVPDAYDISKTLDNPEIWYGPEMNSEIPSLKRIIDEAGLLHMAALDQSVDMVRFLLSKGAEINHVPSTEQCCRRPSGTALHIAVSASLEGRVSKPEVIEVLLHAHADPSLRDELGQTPVEINDRYGNDNTKDAIRKLLLESIRDKT